MKGVWSLLTDFFILCKMWDDSEATQIMHLCVNKYQVKVKGKVKGYMFSSNHLIVAIDRTPKHLPSSDISPLPSSDIILFDQLLYYK